MSIPLLDRFDRQRQIRTEITVDSETGLLLIKVKQDMRQIVDDNVRRQNMVDRHDQRRRRTTGAGGVMVANIPMQEYWRLHRLGITRDRKAMLKYLSSREARAWRVDDGRRLA
jgi:uncharacterized alpha-E superfamily protein